MGRNVAGRNVLSGRNVSWGETSQGEMSQGETSQGETSFREKRRTSEINLYFWNYFIFISKKSNEPICERFISD